MPQLTAEGRRELEAIAERQGFSPAAAEVMLAALVAGHGSQAQFNHPELGGLGQWSRGGMLMIGDMFNNGLKSRVDALASDLSVLLDRTAAFGAASGQSLGQSQSQSGTGPAGVSLFVRGSGGGGGTWWPADLGAPSSTGAQNNLRYAVFPGTRRLAIDQGGRVSLYDTGDHLISGVSQAQSGDQTLTFTSQHGLVRLCADIGYIGLDHERDQVEDQIGILAQAGISRVAQLLESHIVHRRGAAHRIDHFLAHLDRRRKRLRIAS